MSRTSRAKVAAMLVAAMALLLVRPQAAQAVVTLSTTPITWDIIGLDSNNENVGPNIFSAGTRVCNTGNTTSTSVTATFNWATANANINLQSGSPSSITIYDSPSWSWAPGECNDFYFNIEVNRNDTVRQTARGYSITAVAAEGASVTTPTPRQLYVENLISQNRNSIASIAGPTNVLVGSVYTYTVTGSTSTAYEQLTTYMNFPNVMFRIISVDAQYLDEHPPAAPANASNDKIWADACGWDSNPAVVPPSTSTNCVGPAQYGGKVGGAITTAFQVEILSAGVATMEALWYDGSGGSFHYNKDFNDGAPNQITVTATKPTAATFVDASAAQGPSGTALTWATASETDNLGFNVYEGQGGTRVRLNDDLIAGSALRTDASLDAGGTYHWFDDSKGSTGPYFIQAVDLDGSSTWHGPVRATASTDEVSRMRSAALVPRASADDTGQIVPRVADPGAGVPSGQAAIADGSAVALDVRREGWYQVALDDLDALGVDTGTPENLHLSAEGVEQAASVHDGVLEFYGMGLDTASTDTRVYWVTSDDTPGQRIASSSATGGPPAPASFWDTFELRDPSLYFSALLNGQASNFFGDVVTGAPADQTLDVPDVASPTGATLEVNLQGVTAGAHTVDVALNGSTLGTVSMLNREQGTATFPVDASLVSGENTLQLGSQGVADISLVDSVRVHYLRSFEAVDGALRATVPSGTEATITGFSGDEVTVLDVTDPAAPVALAATVAPDGGGFAATATVPSGGERTLFAVEGTESPADLRANDPGPVGGASDRADLLIVTTDELKDSFAPLAAHRRQQGLVVKMATIENIYDHFSYGEESPAALDAFLASVHKTWQKAPRYVLLGGDASLDPRSYLGHGDEDLVPTIMRDTTFMETSSDATLADVNGDIRPEFALGRLPARTPGEADAVVEKLLAYDGAAPSNGALMIADSGDHKAFASINRAVKRLLPGSMDVTSIVRGDDAQSHAAVISGINEGPSVTQYAGHGSIDVWRGSLLSNQDTPALTNDDHPSFFVLMTCLNGYFVDPGLDSLSEALLRAHGGAIGSYASTGLTYAKDQRLLTLAFNRALFDGAPRIGDAVVAAGRSARDKDILKTWVLLGDPSMKLR